MKKSLYSILNKKEVIQLNELKAKIIELISNYPGVVIGSLIGLLVGLLIITFGLGKVIILFICILLAAFLGFVVTKMKE